MASLVRVSVSISVGEFVKETVSESLLELVSVFESVPWVCDTVMLASSVEDCVVVSDSDSEVVNEMIDELLSDVLGV